MRNIHAVLARKLSLNDPSCSFSQPARHKATSMNVLTLILLGCLLAGRAASQQLIIESSIYQGVSASPCTRLLNGTSAIGCQNAGDVGILRRLSSDGELTTAISDGIPGKYAFVMPYSLLTRVNVAKMVQSGKVAGILLL
ncbi:hypothetical protein BJ742DRAFT_787487 [Cladochytrium replicatum]|nr:hypothetical protein BJ742DRAFT_787487 [Cladochytrium replicatum]